MTYPYTYTPTINGFGLFDIECEIDATFDPADECIQVLGVFVTGSKATRRIGKPDGFQIETFDILGNSDNPHMAALGAMIAQSAEQDTDLLARVSEDQGYAFVSRGGTDPDAHWREAV